jgi:hypothetical protein
MTHGTRFLLSLLLLTACSGLLQPRTYGGGAQESSTPSADKIATSLRHVIQRMQEDGVSAANASSRQAQAYTTPLVRVDPTGDLHVLLLVTDTDEQVRSQLREYRARIERVEPSQQFIQAWVPFERLEEVAALPFVRYVRPPSYVVTH